MATPEEVYRTRPPSLRQQNARPDGAKAAQFTPDVIQAVLEGGGWWGNSYGAMYRKQPAVRSIVDFLARNIAQLNAKVYERVSNTDRLEVPDHPLAVLLQNPNPVTTRYRHMRQTVSDLALYDRAYWRKIRVGRSLAVARISPAYLCIETDEYGNRTYRANGKEIPRDQLVIFPGYSPDSTEEGISPLETLRRVLREESNISQAREAAWRNASRASGWIQRPIDAPEWSDAGRQRFRADIEAMLAGANNAGRIGVLEEGMTWNSGTYAPPDTEYINSRRLTYEEVAIVYFGPIGGRAWLDAATQTGSEENHRQMYQDVLGPILEQLQEEIELQLLPEVQPLKSGHVRRVQPRGEAQGLVRGAGEGGDHRHRGAVGVGQRDPGTDEPATDRRRPLRHAGDADERDLRRPAGGHHPHRGPRPPRPRRAQRHSRWRRRRPSRGRCWRAAIGSPAITRICSASSSPAKSRPSGRRKARRTGPGGTAS
jgi:HK97 family phage portal protein